MRDPKWERTALVRARWLFARRAANGKSKTQNDAPRSIHAVLQEHTTNLMSITGVVGAAVGEYEGKPCIKVFVARRTAELVAQVPASLEGYPVTIEETGEFHPREPESS